MEGLAMTGLGGNGRGKYGSCRPLFCTRNYLAKSTNLPEKCAVRRAERHLIRFVGFCSKNEPCTSLILFSFFEIEPGFDSDGFVKYKNSLNNDTFNGLIEQVQELNKEISRDKSLGKGFCIGHSYFCGQDACSDDWMYSIVEHDILPMLSEYWFDDSGKLQRWENILRGVFND